MLIVSRKKLTILSSGYERFGQEICHQLKTNNLFIFRSLSVLLIQFLNIPGIDDYRLTVLLYIQTLY